MATIAAKSAEQTKLETVPITLLAPEELRGRIRVSKTTYTWLTGYVDAGSTITGVALPKGARMISGCLVSQAGLATSTIAVTLTDGTTTVTVSAALAIGASAVRFELPDAANWHSVIGVDVGGLSPKMTTATAAMVAGNKVALMIYYVVD